MEKITNEEFKNVVAEWGIVQALKVVNIDQLKDQQLRVSCQRFQNYYDEIMSRLNNPDPKLIFVQE